MRGFLHAENGASRRVELYDYQRHVVRKVEEWGGRALLALEMGLGKTICVLAWLRKDKRDRLPCCVVCPALVKENWREEAERAGFSVAVLHGQRPYTIPSRDVVIVNYDILHDWRADLVEYGFQTIVLDECHYLAHTRSKRTKAARYVAFRIPNRIALSGTPALNRPAELFPVLNIIRPDVFDNWFRFANRYCSPRLRPWGWDYSGASNVEELNEKLMKTCMVRIRKCDVLPDISPKVRKVVRVQLEDTSQYEMAYQDYVRWLRRYSPHQLRTSLRAVSLSRLQAVLMVVAQQKVQPTIRFLDKLLRDREKIVVFGIHRCYLRPIADYYGDRCVLVDGTSTSLQRKRMMKRFLNDDNVRLYVANIIAGGVGVNLVNSNTVVFGEFSWRPSDHLQAEDRVHRIGQRRRAYVYYLVADGTLEERIMRILHRKQDVLSRLIDRGKGERLNLYNILTQELFEEVVDVH